MLHSIPPHHYLVISQQRCPLPILADDLATRERIASKQAGHTDSKRKQEEQTTNCKGKDPLELEEMWAGKELSNAGC